MYMMGSIHSLENATNSKCTGGQEKEADSKHLKNLSIWRMALGESILYIARMRTTKSCQWRHHMPKLGKCLQEGYVAKWLLCDPSCWTLEKLCSEIGLDQCKATNISRCSKFWCILLGQGKGGWNIPGKGKFLYIFISQMLQPSWVLFL